MRTEFISLGSELSVDTIQEIVLKFEILFLCRKTSDFWNKVELYISLYIYCLHSCFFNFVTGFENNIQGSCNDDL